MQQFQQSRLAQRGDQVAGLPFVWVWLDENQALRDEEVAPSPLLKPAGSLCEANAVDDGLGCVDHWLGGHEG